MQGVRSESIEVSRCKASAANADWMKDLIQLIKHSRDLILLEETYILALNL